MSQSKSSAAHLISRLVLCILLAFTLLGTVGGAIGVYVTASPALLVTQLDKQDAAQKAHDTLQTKFETAYNATAVPAEVYLDVITVDWMEEAMENWVTANYSKKSADQIASCIDYTSLEESITAYFEQYAAENNYEKDDAYTQKLAETIQSAEETVQSAVDVYHIQTMRDANVWSKLEKLQVLLWIVAIGCAVLSVVLMLLLWRCRPCYWIGTSLFASGTLLTLSAALVLGTSVISHFSLKEPAVYAAFTGTMTALTQMVLIIGILLLAAGLGLCIGNIRYNKKVPACAEAEEA